MFCVDDRFGKVVVTLAVLGVPAVLGAAGVILAADLTKFFAQMLAR